MIPGIGFDNYFDNYKCENFSFKDLRQSRASRHFQLLESYAGTLPEKLHCCPPSHWWRSGRQMHKEGGGGVQFQRIVYFQSRHLRSKFQWSFIIGLTFSYQTFWLLKPVFRIHDILEWIQIRGSMPLTNGFGSGSGSASKCHGSPTLCVVKCWGTWTVGTVTFCRSRTGTVIYYGFGIGITKLTQYKIV